MKPICVLQQFWICSNNGVLFYIQADPPRLSWRIMLQLLNLASARRASDLSQVHVDGNNLFR